MGALASGGARVLNDEVIEALRIPRAAIEEAARRESSELERRERLYRGESPQTEVQGRVVILVDDGLATGSTMRAAVAALKSRSPARIVLAVPVAAPEICARLRQEVDEAVCLLEPQFFNAVGAWYEDFSQTSDDEVRRLLAAAGSAHAEVQRS